MSLVSAETVFWLILAAAVIHVVEEYATGWVNIVNKLHLPMRMSMRRFTIINILFLALCVSAAIANIGIPVFSLSIAILVLVNGLIHIAWTIKLRRYFPGVASSILLYIPFSIYAYYLLIEAGLLTSPIDFALSIVLGVAWMAITMTTQLAYARQSE
nr:HXXEE domain-containing protein [Candidatus Njordarchaeota archaeon]